AGAESVLSEDPGIVLERGQSPVVLDPFMFLRLGEKRPRLVSDLVERIEEREFDRIVLLYRPDTAYGEWWYSAYNFGPETADAIVDSYQPVGRIGTYYVYGPR
ncbi:MAG TPA: hypothetical protein VEA19_01085, partial [Actinomycetota bacterium]|nr:hypothetical protein [Actinomycetota bacterium]